jgi:Carboxypeptidase regulatory-like domain
MATFSGGNMKQWIRASLGLTQGYKPCQTIDESKHRSSSINGNNVRNKLLPALALVTLLSPALTVVAQNTNSGDIRGTVTDSTGALIPGVTVSVHDVDKNETKVLQTNSAGLYDTGPIVPDHYVITFTKDGFSTFQRGPITLDVSIQTINGNLKVGQDTQHIVVNANDVPLLSTESGAIETTLSSDVISQLPQTNLGADWENFIVLLPGAVGAPENASSASNPGSNASINGNLPFETVLADGATTTLPQSENTDVTIFETTSEVVIASNGFSAQYGQGGILYNQISKGGSNRFHGAGYEYFSNDAFNAFGYQFGNQAGSLPELRFNNFGVFVSGPIIKNKLFFSFDFDKTINNSKSVQTETLPLAQNAAIATGDFTAPGLPLLYDPTTQQIQLTGSHTYSLVSGTSVTQQCPCAIRQTFASEYHNGNRIPTALLNPVALNFQTLIQSLGKGALNQSLGTGTTQLIQGIVQNNYAFIRPSTNPFTKYFGRLDYDVFHNNRLTVSETESDNPGVYTGNGLQVCPINCQNEDVSRNNAQVSDVWNYSSSLINEARMGFTDQLNFFSPQTLGKGYPAQLGYQLAEIDLLPNLSPGSNISGFNAGNGTNPFIFKEIVYDPSDVVTLIRGRHILHFGGEFLIEDDNSTPYGYITAGTPTFSGNYTSEGGNITKSIDGGNATYGGDGAAYADFLLGQSNSWSAQNQPEFGGRTKTPQVFIQDDWKARPNLTLNLGMRYEIHTGWSEVHGNETVFDPTLRNPANNSLGAEWYAFNQTNGRTQLIAPQYNVWLPRFGASWQPLANTVIRGGIGIYVGTLSVDNYGGGLGAAFGSSGNVSDTTNGVCPVLQIDSNGTTPDTVNPGCGVVAGGTNFNTLTPAAAYLAAPTTANARNGQGVTQTNYHTPLPHNLQWNLDVQRQIGNNYVIDVAYVGNHGYDLSYNNVDLNQVPQSQLSANDLNSKPFPLFNNIAGTINTAVSNYNALQAQMTKRYSYGLTFNVNYTWSHFLDDLDSSGFGSREGYQNYQNAFSPASNYSNSNFDVRNQFKGQAVYELPFGRGRQFLNKNLLLGELIGGWKVSSVWVIEGGNPIGITTGGNNSSNNQSGSYTQFANRVPGVSLREPGSVKQRLNEYYNLAALAVPAPYTYGNFLRNVVYGPGVVNVAASLGKTFDLYPQRGIKMEIRADAGNVLNHPSFGQPNGNAIGPGEVDNITSTTVGGRQIQLYGRVSF